MSELSLLLFIVFLTYWSGFFSSSEIALFSLPNTTIRAFEESKAPRKQKVAALLRKPRDLLVTIFMLNTLVNILLQNASSSLFGLKASWTLRVGVPLIITLILGEIIPKYIAMQRNVSFSLRVSRTIYWMTEFIRPVREWTVRVTTPISRVLFFFLKKDEPLSKDELSHVLKSSEESGVLSGDEARLIYGFLELRDTLARDHMQPREDVIFYNLNDPLTKLIHLFADMECSRVPVCEGELDHVVGILPASTFFLYRPLLKDPKEVVPLTSKPLFIPENTTARNVMITMEEKHERISLLVDEHKGVVGLISIEDLVEEVVGEITDERDQAPLFERQGRRGLVVNAKMELSELNALIGSKLTSPHQMQTIGGWLTEYLGEIPKPGTSAIAESLLFQVLETDERHIKKIYIKSKEDLKIDE